MTEHNKIWILAFYTSTWQDSPDYSELAFSNPEMAENYLNDLEEGFGTVLGPFYVVGE